MGRRRMQYSYSVRSKKSNRGLAKEFAEILQAKRYARFVFWLPGQIDFHVCSFWRKTN